MDILSNLRHNYIIRYVGIGKFSENTKYVGGKTGVAMELASQGELFKYVAEQSFDEKLCKYYLRQAVEGLMHIHSNQIAHRDIKLDNILLDENFSIKIADFGRAIKFF